MYAMGKLLNLSCYCIVIILYKDAMEKHLARQATFVAAQQPAAGHTSRQHLPVLEYKETRKHETAKDVRTHDSPTFHN